MRHIASHDKSRYYDDACIYLSSCNIIYTVCIYRIYTFEIGMNHSKSVKCLRRPHENGVTIVQQRATKKTYKRQGQFLENLSLWNLCRTAVRINGVTIFRAARCLDTQEHDVHFQKLLQNAAKKSPFGWL